MDNSHTAYWSMIKRHDIIEANVALLCAPRFTWVVLREDRLAHQTPIRPMSDRSVPRIEPQVERQLVCTRTVRSKSNVCPNMSSLALVFFFCEEQIQYRRSQRRHLELVLPLSRSAQRYSSLKLLAKIAICNLLEWSTRRTDCLGTRAKHFACCLGAFLDQRLCRRTTSFDLCLGGTARFLIRCLVTRTSSFVRCGLCMASYVPDHRSPFPAICGTSA